MSEENKELDKIQELFGEVTDSGLTVTGPDGRQLKVMITDQVREFCYENDIDIEKEILAALEEDFQKQKQSLN